MKKSNLLPFLLIIIATLNTTKTTAQDLIGTEWFACNIFEDSTFMKFENDTVYFKMKDAIGFEDFIPVSTYFISTNDVIEWNDIPDSGGCNPKITGRYNYEIEMNILTFEEIRDECVIRLDVISELIFKSESTTNTVSREIENLKIYPNPVLDRLVVSGIEENEYTYIIYNQVGTQVKSGVIRGQQTINTGNIISGSYILKLVNTKNQSTMSFKILHLN